MKYTDEQLQLIKKVELSIMKEVHRVCEENQIDYFLGCGTLIGAVRHGGFIPWDDDIDIIMLQKDYDRFLEIAQEKLGDRFFVQTCETDKNYPMSSAKIRLTEVKFVEDYMRKIDMNHGAYIDVFCFFNLPDDEQEYEKYIKEVYKYEKILQIKSTPEAERLKTKGIKYLIKKITKWFVSQVLFAPVSKMKTYKKIVDLRHKYENEKTTYCGTQDRKFKVKYEYIYPKVKIKFEDTEFYTFNNYHEYLKGHFGDYMKLPPEDKRVNHAPYYVDYDAARRYINEIEG